MYTDENLSSAIRAGIFSEDAVNKFRSLVSSEQNLSSADEERFRLVTGFNDIFVTIACGLLLLAVAWIGYPNYLSLSSLAIAVISLGLSEFFVLKRRMALPAIFLLTTFVASTYLFVDIAFNALGMKTGWVPVFAAGCTSLIGSYFHWRRYGVPITIAASAVVLIGSIYAIVLALFPKAEDWSLLMLFMGGLLSFATAMHWDIKDTSRVTRRSDVAFWLHLISAPLIVHPIFSILGVMEEGSSLSVTMVVALTYLLLTIVSIAIDRRALMVSALAYVVYSFSVFIESFGHVSLAFSIAGIIVGAALILLSAFWQSSRSLLLSSLPKQLLDKLPPLN